MYLKLTGVIAGFHIKRNTTDLSLKRAFSAITRKKKYSDIRTLFKSTSIEDIKRR